MTRRCAVGPCDRRIPQGETYCEHHGPVPEGATAPTGPTLEVDVDTCPFCASSGHITQRRRRIRAARRPASKKLAVMTAGWSLLLRGPTPRLDTVELTCQVCGSVWYVSVER